MAKNTGAIASTLSGPFDPNTVYTPKMSTVFVDWKWNSRFTESNGDEVTEETGHLGVVKDIARHAVDMQLQDGGVLSPMRGQKTPVVLRPCRFYGKKGHPGASCPFEVVSGFGRVRAILAMARGEHDANMGAAGLNQAQVTAMHSDDPCIRAFVRKMTEAEARRENLGENMLRASLSAPDIAFGVAELYKALPEGTTADQVALMIGRSQQYVSKLFRVYQGLSGVVLPPGSLSKSQTAAIPVLEAWRSGTGKKPTNDEILAVAEALDEKGNKLSAAEKAKKYLATVAPAEEKKKKKQGPGAWEANAAQDAEEFGVLLGNLARDGAIEILAIEGKHCATVAAKYAAKIASDKGTEDVLDAIAVACTAGIRKGKRKAPVLPKEEEKGGEEGAAPKAPKGGKRKGANGVAEA